MIIISPDGEDNTPLDCQGKKIFFNKKKKKKRKF